MRRFKWTLGLACLACCTVPLLAIASGVLGLSAARAIALSANLTELPPCLAPIVVLALGYLGYQAYRRRNRCGSSPAVDCTSTFCGTSGRSRQPAEGGTSWLQIR